MVKKPRKITQKQPDDSTAELVDTGRWVEASIPTKGNAKQLTVASLYGISGSSSDGRKRNLNEMILTQAVRRAVEAPRRTSSVETST